jgi:hypothetical protein
MERPTETITTEETSEIYKYVLYPREEKENPSESDTSSDDTSSDAYESSISSESDFETGDEEEIFRDYDMTRYYYKRQRLN